MPTATETDKRTGRFNFRTTPRQDTLIRAAARMRGVSTSRYVADSASNQAEMDLADRRHFSIPARRMAAFMKALDRPAREKPRLGRLLGEPTVLERE